MTSPAYQEYGLLAWLRKHRTLAYTGYAEIHATPQRVHLLVFRWLLWWPRYFTYTQHRLAHEYAHCVRQSEWHDPAPGDVMSEKTWNARTDKTGAMWESMELRKSLPFRGIE